MVAKLYRFRGEVDSVIQNVLRLPVGFKILGVTLSSSICWAFFSTVPSVLTVLWSATHPQDFSGATPSN
jgi:hypothetical protein